jgi:putative protease
MDQSTRPAKPEIMSPAGYWPQLQAAIEAGADAVYFGLKHFTARAKVGFSLQELPEVMRTLHRRGVKGYLTFNTLVFDHELAEAAKTLAAVIEAGVDALIVQDIGVAQLARRLAPDVELHGSTQMSITSAEGIHLAQQFGVSRVVLARELSLAEIRTIRAQTDCDLEMFVHGALCVSYSGQCFSSEAWGGRSANRGQCAQACRLPYELLVDDRLYPLGEARYLLSPGDLSTLTIIPEIMPLGLAALKIEGRYKEADYVALTTQAYRRAVDEAWAGQPLSHSRADELHLEQVFSRGLAPHFVSGANHQTVVRGRSPRHRGVLMGRVVRVLADGVLIEPEPAAAKAPLKAGDGLVFDAADWRSPEEPEEGGRVYHVLPQPHGHLKLTFANRALIPARIRPGDWVWRSHSPDLDKAMRPLTQAGAPVRRQPLRVSVSAIEGQPLRTEWFLLNQPAVRVTVESAQPLGRAQTQALTKEFLQAQFSRLGHTPYHLAELHLEQQGRPFAPSSVLNQLRRQAVEQLTEQQGRPRSLVVADPLATLAELLAGPAPASPETTAPQLHLLVRTPEQLAAALDLRPASITLDYLDLYGLRPAVKQIQAAGLEGRVASPRILKPDEQQIINFLLKLDCPLLVRSGGLLHALQAHTPPPLMGDFSLNAANVIAARTFLQLGLLRLTPSHDLNAAQIVTLAEQLGPAYLEVVIYQHLPIFHTEHCVFCRFLSSGASYKDCGQPCEKHRVALRDGQGRAHPVLADVGCRNTVFGAEAQEASRHLPALQQAGLHHFRLEFVHETAVQVQAVTRAFTEALAGQLPPPDLARRLQAVAPQGLTEGSLFVPDNYLSLPLL